MQMPPKCHAKHGAIYYVHRNKWHRLCRDDASYSQIERALALLHRPKPPKTIDELLTKYQNERLPELAYSTQDDYHRIIEQILRPEFGHMPLDKLETGHVGAYLERRRRAGHGPAGNREMSVLSSAFDYAIRQPWLNSNPCRGVRRNKERPRRRYVSDQELETALQAASEPLRLVLLFALLTGLRQSDIRNLKRSQLLDSRIRLEEGKTGAGLDIIWSDELRRVVEQARTDSEHVFTNSHGQPWSKWGLQSAIRRLKLDWNFHDLRAKAETDHAEGLGLLTRYKRRKVVTPLR